MSKISHELNIKQLQKTRKQKHMAVLQQNFICKLSYCHIWPHGHSWLTLDVDCQSFLALMSPNCFQLCLKNVFLKYLVKGLISLLGSVV